MQLLDGGNSRVPARLTPPSHRLQREAEVAADEAAQLPPGSEQLPERAALATAVAAIRNVTFRRANFIEMTQPAGSIDVVLCLSVSKWCDWSVCAVDFRSLSLSRVLLLQGAHQFWGRGPAEDVRKSFCLLGTRWDFHPGATALEIVQNGIPQTEGVSAAP